MSKPKTTGWAFARRRHSAAHYFREGVSLCGKWKIKGEFRTIAHAPLDCKECHDLRVKELER